MGDGLPSDGASSHCQPQGMLGYGGYKPMQFDSQGQSGHEYSGLNNRVAGDDGSGGIKPSPQNYPEYSGGGPSQAYMGQGSGYMQPSSRYFSGVGQGKPSPSMNPAVHSQNSFQPNPLQQRSMRPSFSGQPSPAPQHAGSTPTLNHLLQSPNSLQQHKESSSSAYSQDGSPKPEPSLAGPSGVQGSPYPIHHHQQGWGSSPRSSLPYSPYPPASSSMYRMQVNVACLWNHCLDLMCFLVPYHGLLQS